jgi:hypothetical protein
MYEYSKQQEDFKIHESSFENVADYIPEESLLIFNDTYLEQEADKLGLILDDYNHFMWTSVYDSGNDFVHRSVNRVSTQLLIDALGYPLAGQNISSLHQVYQQLLRKEQELTRTLNDLTPITTDQLRLPA